MEDNILKDLFVQKRYNEVIEILEGLYEDLFWEMLEYKNVKREYEGYTFRRLAKIIPVEYPCFQEQITVLDSARTNTDNSYLDTINIMLSIYVRLKDTYKTAQEEEEVELSDEELNTLFGQG